MRALVKISNMNRHSLKTLALALAVFGAAGLAACDKAKEPVEAVQQQVTEVVDTIKGNTLGYPLVPQQLIFQLDDSRHESISTILKLVRTNFPMFLEQVAGLRAQSPEFTQVEAFSSAFEKRFQNKAALAYPIALQFAVDLASETLIFEEAQEGYGYAPLPTENKPGTYQAYRQQLVDNFKHTILERLNLFADEEFVAKTIPNYADFGMEAVTKEATALVNDYLALIDTLTKNDMVCSLQDSEISKSECFRDYMTLVASYPEAIAATYLIDSINESVAQTNGTAPNDQQFVANNFGYNLVNRLIAYYNLYIKFANIPEFDAKSLN